VTADATVPSARKIELLEASYGYVLSSGLTDLSLRPLAAAVGSSPRVLLYLFGSKDGLIRALLARARQDELDLMARLPAGVGLPDTARHLWSWLAAPEHRSLLRLWVQAYATSLVNPEGAWAGFAGTTVQDWLDVLAASQPVRRRRTAAGAAERTLVLAVLRGAMIDLLATGDLTRTTAAVRRQLTALDNAPRPTEQDRIS
jgi:AcrR family transcriptional regulator